MRTAAKRESDFPHRVKVLAVNRRLAQRIVAVHRDWLDALEAQL